MYGKYDRSFKFFLGKLASDVVFGILNKELQTFKVGSIVSVLPSCADGRRLEINAFYRVSKVVTFNDSNLRSTWLIVEKITDKSVLYSANQRLTLGVPSLEYIGLFSARNFELIKD